MGMFGGKSPSFITALASGSFTPDNDITGGYTISHNLGVIPKVLLIYTNDYNSASGFEGSNYGVMLIFVNDSREGGYQSNSFFAYSSQGAYANVGRTSTTNNGIRNVTSSLATLDVRSGSTMLKSGITYNWICWA